MNIRLAIAKLVAPFPKPVIEAPIPLLLDPAPTVTMEETEFRCSDCWTPYIRPLARNMGFVLCPKCSWMASG